MPGWSRSLEVMEKSWNLKRKLDRSCKARIQSLKIMCRDLKKLVASRRSLLLILKRLRNLELLFSYILSEKHKSLYTQTY